MISVIVSTCNEINFSRLQNSVIDTIGVEYEIIKILNQDAMSICEAYNQGIKLSKFDILVFVHDDVIFNEAGWGLHLINHFLDDPKIGLIGIAGSSAKTKAPSAWPWNGNRNNFHYLVQYSKGKLERDYTGKDAYLLPNSIFETLLIDGVFMAMHKRTELRFDERIQGFHEYDLSLSLISYFKGFKNIISTYIKLTHFSLGKRDGIWLESADRFTDLYKDYLPVCLDSAKEQITIKTESKNYALFVNRSIQYNKKNLAKKYLKFLFKISYYKPVAYKLLLRLLFK